MIDAVVGGAYSLNCNESSNVDYAGSFRISCMSFRYSSPLAISLTFIDAISDDPQLLMCRQDPTRYLSAVSLLPPLPLTSPRRHLPVYNGRLQLRAK